jgi:hypothetical protein
MHEQSPGPPTRRLVLRGELGLGTVRHRACCRFSGSDG